MHLLNLRIGAWRFAPTLWPTLAALAFFLLTLFLGHWQSGRAAEKRTLQARLDAALAGPAIHVGNAPLDADGVLSRKLEARGVFDDAHTLLLDNRVRAGKAGYYVLTPLRLDGGARAILVNRGWVAAGPTRDRLPVVPVPQGTVVVEGVAAATQTRYVELGDAAPQGRVWQNLDFARYAGLYRLDLQPVVLQQTSAADDGLARDWPRPDSGVAMHVGYAFQWYSLATTLALLWFGMNLRRERADGEPESENNQREPCN